MTVAAAVTGCTTTSQFLLKGTGAPLLLLSCHRRRPSCVPTSSSTTSTTRAITNYSISYPAPPAIYNFNAISPSRRTLRMLLSSCYCTDSNTTATATSTLDADPAKEAEGSESNSGLKIKEAANTLDIRVGRILKAWRHEEADSLYVEEVDVGEAEPRTICSGLVKYIPLDLLQDRSVIVLANLKPRNMCGVKSAGMLMAASDTAHENVELLVPPEGSVPGERVWFGSVDEKEKLPEAASPNQIQKKKIWELVQPHLKTDDSCVAVLGAYTMRTAAGVVTSESLKNANIS